MNKEKITLWSLLLLGIVAGGIIFFTLMDYIIPIFSPFLIAWAVAFAVRMPAKKLSLLVRIPERIVRVFLAIFATLFAFGILGILIWQLVAALWRFLSELGEGSVVYDALNTVLSPNLPFFGDGMPSELKNRINEAINSMISTALSKLGEAVSSWVSAVPGALFFLLVTVIALVYFAYDLEKINEKVRSYLPARISGVLSRLRAEFFSVGGKYLRSYLLIMIITFVIMLVGFMILGIAHAPLIALIVAFLDLLPVIGVGTVLIPWSIFQFMSGNLALGIGLIVLFLVNEIVRQFAEPKIVGKSLNMHPILTLVFLYVGYALFGIWGLIVVPVSAVIAGLLLKENHSPKVD